MATFVESPGGLSVAACGLAFPPRRRRFLFRNATVIPRPPRASAANAPKPHHVRRRSFLLLAGAQFAELYFTAPHNGDFLGPQAVELPNELVDFALHRTADAGSGERGISRQERQHAYSVEPFVERLVPVTLKAVVARTLAATVLANGHRVLYNLREIITCFPDEPGAAGGLVVEDNFGAVDASTFGQPAPRDADIGGLDIQGPAQPAL